MDKLFLGADGICFEILDVLHINRPKSKKFHTVPRSFSSLSVRLSGNGTFFFENQKIEVYENDMLFCPSNTRYHQISKDEELIAIHINIHDDCTFLPQKISATKRAQETFLAVYDVWNKKNKGYKYYAHALIACYLAEFTSDSFWAKDYIEKNLANPCLSVGLLAKNEHVSEQYFRRKFKMKYGVSPSEYITNSRIERAKTLLDTEYYNVSEVSKMVGIEDSLYFSTLFKKHVGISPSKYRLNK